MWSSKPLPPTQSTQIVGNEVELDTQSSFAKSGPSGLFTSSVKMSKGKMLCLCKFEVYCVENRILI